MSTERRDLASAWSDQRPRDAINRIRLLSVSNGVRRGPG